MKCRNCGKNEANFIYTKVINGEKQEIVLCSECAKKLGLENINLNFNMPIDFSSFLGDFFDEDDELFLNPFESKNNFKCLNCGMTFEEFLNKGKFGCSNCYSTFEPKLDDIIKQIHGAKKHVGKRARRLEKAKEEIKNEKANNQQKEINYTKSEKVNELKTKLKLAINEERYEEAAKIRDEIKLLEGKDS